MTTALPAGGRWPTAFAAWWCRGLVRRRFAALRVAGTPPTGDAPVICFLNHPSWWDPIVGLLLARAWWPRRTHRAAIDPLGLARWPFLRRLGFFPADPRGGAAAARRFLADGDAALAPGAVLWLTPQGRLADPRERPLRLASGLAHLAARRPDALLLPIALEYPFWDADRPEILVRVGAPVARASGERARDLHARCEAALAATADGLAALASRREVARFHVLVAGRGATVLPAPLEAAPA